MTAVATQVFTKSPYDDETAWLAHPAHEPPLSAAEIAQVQSEIDLIAGTTRDNKPIAQLVWSGDRKYWKPQPAKYDSVGNLLEMKARPWVLYQTIVDSGGKFIRDAFVPRWIILTRIEPEQFAPTWKRDTQKWSKHFGKFIRVQPEDPPDVFWSWYMTIAEHQGNLCCQSTAKTDPELICYGRYAHPRACLDELRQARKGIEASGIRSQPFDAPTAWDARMRERGLHDYENQALMDSIDLSAEIAEASPLAFASAKLLEEGAGPRKIREHARETAKRSADRLENELHHGK